MRENNSRASQVLRDGNACKCMQPPRLTLERDIEAVGTTFAPPT